jgi:CO/xanthine dehydrogenase Mo-binding subunit
MAYKVIGKRVIRKDQLTKCTGTAVYNIDVVKPNTLYCQMVGSPHAYA